MQVPNVIDFSDVLAIDEQPLERLLAGVKVWVAFASAGAHEKGNEKTVRFPRAHGKIEQG